MSVPSEKGRPAVVLVYPSIEPSGGIERYVLEVAERLTGRFDVTVAGSRGRAHLPAGCRWLQIPAPPFPGFLQTLGFALASTWSLRKRRVAVNAQGATHLRPEVVTAHSCHRAWYRSSLRSVRTGSWPWVRKLMNPLHPVTLWIESIQYRRARAVIAVSEGVKREIVEGYGLPPERIVVSYGGVDLHRFRPAGVRDKEELRRVHGVDPESLVCVFVANEFRRKGLRVLMEAVARVDDPSLVMLVVGRGHPGPYEALADRLGLAGRVRFTGVTDDTAPWYRLADLFALPTEYEPFGLVVAEALASGLPVITSASAGVSECLEPGRDALLLEDPRDVDEVARALRRLLDPGERERLAAGARKAAERFTWDRVTERVAAALDAVLSPGGPGSPSRKTAP